MVGIVALLSVNKKIPESYSSAASIVILVHVHWARTRPLVYLSINKPKRMGSYEVELSQPISYQSKRLSYLNQKNYMVSTRYFLKFHISPLELKIFSLYFVVKHPNYVVLDKISPSNIRLDYVLVSRQPLTKADPALAHRARAPFENFEGCIFENFESITRINFIVINMQR